MGKEDTNKAGSNCLQNCDFSVQKFHAVERGTATLKDVQFTETFREWVSRIDRLRIKCWVSVTGARHPFPSDLSEIFQAVISKEIKESMKLEAERQTARMRFWPCVGRRYQCYRGLLSFY